MSKRLLILLLVLAAAASPSRAQELRGFVAEARGEQPLQGASVVLLRDGGVRLGTTTDGDGFFRFARVEPGAWRLRVTFIGFEPWEETVQLAAGLAVTRSVFLVEAAEGLDEVVVESEAASGVAAVVAGLETIRPKDVVELGTLCMPVRFETARLSPVRKVLSPAPR